MTGAAFAPPLLYSRCWEDDAVLRRGLEVTPGERVLSIASAGDNTLALLLDDPGEVIAVDRNATQLALVELKMIALRELVLPDCRRFLGAEVATGEWRRRTYARLRPSLSERARGAFDRRVATLERGVLGAGKLERYLTLFRRAVLPLVQTPGTVRAMLTAPDLATQQELWDRRWDNARWRALFRVFFGRALMSRLGRDPAFFAQIGEADVAESLLGRSRRAFTTLSVGENPWLVWILTGRTLPPTYLSDAFAPLIRSRLDRVTLLESDLDTVTGGPFDAFNLSDCLEYLTADASDALLRRLCDLARPGARMLYWNLLVPRDGGRLRDRLDPLDTSDLHAADRVFFYDRVVLERAAPVPTKTR